MIETRSRSGAYPGPRPKRAALPALGTVGVYLAHWRGEADTADAAANRVITAAVERRIVAAVVVDVVKREMRFVCVRLCVEVESKMAKG